MNISFYERIIHLVDLSNTTQGYIIQKVDAKKIREIINK
jgi:hypothetical protein